MSEPVLLLALAFGAIIAVGSLSVLAHDLLEGALQRRREGARRVAEVAASLPSSGAAPLFSPPRARPASPKRTAAVRAGRARASTGDASALLDGAAQAGVRDGASTVAPVLVASERPVWYDAALRDVAPARGARAARRG